MLYKSKYMHLTLHLGRWKSTNGASKGRKSRPPSWLSKQPAPGLVLVTLQSELKLLAYSPFLWKIQPLVMTTVEAIVHPDHPQGNISQA